MQSVGNGNRTIVYDGKIAGLYDLEETLGSGHFAVVKLARHVFTGEKVAVKVIDKTKLDEVSRAHLFQEVRCMKLVQHPNVVRLYEVIDTQTKLYLILELGDGGDLYDYIMKHEGGLSENLAREYFRQIVTAISYCHQLHVVHRDLKPENVVFFEKLGVVKLTDFGFSNKFCPGQKLETSCGSLAYSAPEILLGDSYDAPAVDVWSLGVILYMLVCGQPPFEKANDSETLTMIMDCKYTMPPHVSDDCRRLISMMLVREPEKRATLSQIASDSWLIQGAGQQEIIPEYLPLVSRQQVSDDDHTLIINKMVSGNIATKEEILEALDRNEYNHITATYFLLAERKLRQQRQEQIQKRRPDLSLPVSGSSRHSPRTRIQNINRDMKPSNDMNNHLLVPTNSQLSTPKTPGVETTSGGRSRKCSIVQEEDDEDEIPGCTNHDELNTPLNRRGSRSEGRINIAIQDRVECERLKKEKDLSAVVSVSSPSPSNVFDAASGALTVSGNQKQSKGLENICGIKKVNKDTNNVRLRLGAAGNSLTSSNRIQLGIEKKIEKNLKISEPSSIISHSTSSETKRKNSFPEQLESGIMKNGDNVGITQTKVLTDSSTIQIPITILSSNKDSNIIPKYKTMPSPTRPTIVLSGPGTRALNEIFEESTDIGSSDTSATTTPRPITRNTHFTYRNSTATPQRKSKFHKTRTPSCSSSDASDDDSESRKKRAHKITDISKPLQSQRRDSHDDSSDSQDQGNASSSAGGGNTSSYLICSTNNMEASTTSSNQDVSGNQTTQNDSLSTSNTHNSMSNTLTKPYSDKGFCEKTEQLVTTNTHFRRHRAGRRRAGETRLRESQSLNRITEVQETTELPQSIVLNSLTNTTNIKQQQQQQQNYSNHNNNSIINNNNNENINKINNNVDSNCFNGVINNLTSSIATTAAVTPTVTTPTIISKPKGLSARLFQGFIKKNDFFQSPSSNTNNTQLQNSQNIDEIENYDGISGNMAVSSVDFSKTIHVTAISSDKNVTNDDTDGITTTKNSSTTKKLKMLGRYFQVHKKLCIPLPGLFQRGRLYKTQSCGSLVREKISSNTKKSKTNNTELKHPTMTSSTIVMQNSDRPLEQQHQQLKQQTNSRHSTVLFVEKGKILRSCLSGKFLGNSDGDINQNQNENDNYVNMIKTKSVSTLVSNFHNNCTTQNTAGKRNSISTDSYCSNYISNGSNRNIAKDDEIVMTTTVAATASLLQQFCSTITTASASVSSSLSSVGLIKSPDETRATTATLAAIASATTTATATAVSLPTETEINLTYQLPANLPLSQQKSDGKDLSKSSNDSKNYRDDSSNDKESLVNSSLHQLNDVPLCSSKC